MNFSIFKKIMILFLLNQPLTLPVFSLNTDTEVQPFEKQSAPLPLQKDIEQFQASQLEEKLTEAKESYENFLEKCKIFTSKTNEYSFADFIMIQKNFNDINTTYISMHFLLLQFEAKKSKHAIRSDQTNKTLNEAFKILSQSEFKYKEVLKFLTHARITVE